MNSCEIQKAREGEGEAVRERSQITCDLEHKGTFIAIDSYFGKAYDVVATIDTVAACAQRQRSSLDQRQQAGDHFRDDIFSRGCAKGLAQELLLCAWEPHVSAQVPLAHALHAWLQGALVCASSTTRLSGTTADARALSASAADRFLASFIFAAF